MCTLYFITLLFHNNLVSVKNIYIHICLWMRGRVRKCFRAYVFAYV